MATGAGAAGSERTAAMSTRTVWMIWGTAALVWLVGSTLYAAANDEFGASPLGIGEPARLSPLLHREACSSLIDPYAANACRGVASLARQRRVNIDYDEAAQQALAGTIIFGPPVGALCLAWLLASRLGMRQRERDRRLDERRRANRSRRR